MDTTKAIREVSDPIRAEYFAMMRELQKTEDDDREGRVKIFANRKWSADAEKHYKEEIREREKIHFDFMGIVFPEMFRHYYLYSLPSGYPPHDYTKDDLFAFLLAIQFDLLKDEKDRKTEEDKTIFEDTKRLVQHELIRHYSAEAHHPEYELHTKKECDEKHIFEMAIDRLARNVQFNHGEINMVQMNKFLPKFFLGDEAEKQRKVNVYLKFMNKYAAQVSKRSKELYYEKK